MELQDLVPGASYSFERHGNTFTGVYVEWFAGDGSTRISSKSKKTDKECVEIQVENPKGGAPLGYNVALEDLTNG